MKDTTSSQKIAKKARQLYRREMSTEAKRMGELIGNIMKTKPKWVPWKLWLWGIKIFIKVK